MKKDEAEKAIRGLCHEWKAQLEPAQLEHPSFTSFEAWVRAKGYGQYLEFRSRMGAGYNAELWFDQELRQVWRR
ncbi:hypothetical protein ACFQI3_02030 [Hansschlegelia quercus]|uniref:Uncharacterized protein n=1 Tax=Hansschlegelia quercus TaxID=2528245 RepID=A0A4V2JEB9_9HYPH|nr:hypothetical protein [Hansschlegelia quercus]TBN54716.1 hypothetical protein EYR15_00670 [Hansschlegelia quercus]